jgi:hypothetical protein
MQHRWLFFLLSILILASCKPTVPSDVIQPDDMADILYDYHIAEAMARRSPVSHDRDFKQSAYFVDVLKKHEVTEAEFDSSLVYYYSHIDRLTKIYDKVGERIDEEGKATGADYAGAGEYAQLSQTGDTANVWHQATYGVLFPDAPYNHMDFELKGDTATKAGDTYVMNFMTDFMFESGTKDAVVYLAETFDNDSVAIYSQHVGMTGYTSVRMPGVNGLKMKSIRGFFYLTRGMDDSNTLKLLFISQIQMVRMRQQDSSQQSGPQPGAAPDTNHVTAPVTGAQNAPVTPQGQSGPVSNGQAGPVPPSGVSAAPIRMSDLKK